MYDVKDLRVSLEAGNRSCVSYIHHIHVARRKPVATGENAVTIKGSESLDRPEIFRSLNTGNLSLLRTYRLAPTPLLNC